LGIDKSDIEYLQHFLLEPGKGFAFIGPQYGISPRYRNHPVERILKLKKD